MKTAISIPNPLFEAAEQLASRLGISRSELFAKAVAAYIDQHRDEGVTDTLNQIYSHEDSSIDPVVQQIQSISLPKEEW